MTVRVAINGFDRSGRNVIRSLVENNRTDNEWGFPCRMTGMAVTLGKLI